MPRGAEGDEQLLLSALFFVNIYLHISRTIRMPYYFRSLVTTTTRPASASAAEQIFVFKKRTLEIRHTIWRGR